MSSHDPDHYKVGGIESIDVIRAKLTPEQFEGFCLGNAMKYVHRAGHKGSKSDDIKKAAVYLEWAGGVRCKCDTPLSPGAILCADCNVAQLEADQDEEVRHSPVKPFEGRDPLSGFPWHEIKFDNTKDKTQ